MAITFDNLEFQNQPSVVDYVRGEFARETSLALLTGHALAIAIELYDRIHDTAAPARFRLLQRAAGRELQFNAGAGWEAVSVPKAIKREAHSGPKLAAVLRSAIRPQTLAFRDRAFSEDATPVCAISGQPLTVEFVDVDHVIMLKDLIQEWLDLTGGERQIEFVKRSGGGYTLAPQQLSSWERFHAGNAVLRLLDRAVHQAHTAAQLALAA